MKTEELVDLLGSAATPVSARRAERHFAVLLAGAAELSLGCMLVWLGPREDWRQALALPAFWMKLAFPLSLALAAFVLLYRLGLPGRRLGLAPWVLAVPLVVVGALGAASWASAPESERLGLLLGDTWWFCPLAIAALSVPAAVLAFRALRTLAPTRLRLAGATAGLFAGAAAASAYAIYCPERGLPFLAVWYVLGMLLPAATGALLGRRLLAW